MKSVVVVVGTRPEVIKMAPLVHELRRRADVETSLVSTGQHRDMSAQSLASFGLTVLRRLFESPEGSRRLGEAARAWATEQFTEKRFGDEIHACLARLVSATS